MQKLIPLKNLRFGEDHVPPLNARKVKRAKEDVEALAASIDAHGLGQALNVVEDKGLAFVEDGNHRLEALLLLLKRGNLTPDSQVKCEINEKEGVDARELGLALNIHRVPMHEADQYEQFWNLHEQGKTDAQIAQRFGYELKTVQKMLALGRLSPLILDAWRTDGLGHHPDDVVRAFTMAPNLKEQEAVFKRLKKAGRLWERNIREAFGSGDGVASRNLNFVGRADYEKAGGKVTEDLFGDNHAVSDAALLAKLAAEKLKKKLDELKAAWAWASPAADLPYGWSWSWTKVKGGKNASAEDRQKSGCAIELKHDGSLEITYGLMKPAAAKAEKAKTARAEGKPAEKKAPELSNAQARDLSITLSQAAQDAIVLNPRVGLAALLAGFACKREMYEIRAVMVSADGFNHMNLGHKKEERFETVLSRFLQMTDADLIKAAAAACVPAINLTTQRTDQPAMKRKDVAALVEALDPKTMQDALVKRFDAKDYFERASKPFVIDAITEAVNADEARKADKLKKAELVKFAVDNVGKAGWLPPELRTSTYAGPGAAKPKPAKKAASMKKAA